MQTEIWKLLLELGFCVVHSIMIQTKGKGGGGSLVSLLALFGRSPRADEIIQCQNNYLEEPANTVIREGHQAANPYLNRHKHDALGFGIGCNSMDDNLMIAAWLAPSRPLGLPVLLSKLLRR